MEQAHNLHNFSLWVVGNQFSYLTGPWISIIIILPSEWIIEPILGSILFYLVSKYMYQYIVFSWKRFNECLILFYSNRCFWIHLIYKISRDVPCSIFRTHKETRWCTSILHAPTMFNMNWRGPICKENNKTLLELFFINIWPYMPVLKVSLCI